MDPVNKIIETDVNTSFENEVNLHKLIGNTNAVEILQTIVNQYFADKSEGKYPSFPTIIISGKENSGRRTMALALNNTLCNCFGETLGQTLSMGGDDIYEYFRHSDKNTTHFINQAERLSSFSQDVVYKILREKILYIAHPIERTIEKQIFGGGLMIMSIDIASKRSLISSVANSIDIHIKLKDEYTSLELFEILKQRIKLLGWSCSGDKIIENIANISNGNVDKAIKVLSFAYRVMRSQNQDIITMAHLNKCLHLLNINHPNKTK